MSAGGGGMGPPLPPASIHPSAAPRDADADVARWGWKANQLRGGAAARGGNASRGAVSAPRAVDAGGCVSSCVTVDCLLFVKPPCPGRVSYPSS